MTNLKRGITTLGAIALAAGLYLGASSADAKSKVPQPDAPAAGKVSVLRGRAIRTREGAPGKELLKKGSMVWAGDTVETVGKSKMEIRLVDKSALRLGPKSKMVIKESSTDGKNERKVSVGLVLGKAWSKVTSTFGGDSKYEVTTENAVAGVRGTTFRVNAEADESTLVRVYAGTVAVKGIRPIYQTHEKGTERKQVAGPQAITKDEWEKTVTGMMSVRIGKDGRPSDPEKFAAADEASGEEGKWVAWNQEMDEAWEKENAEQPEE